MTSAQNVLSKPKKGLKNHILSKHPSPEQNECTFMTVADIEKTHERERDTKVG